MSLVTITKSTRGKNSREVSFQGIGRYETKTIQRETAEDGSPLGKDEAGNQITRPEEVSVLETDGVITSIDEALELCGGDLQTVLNDFAIGYNKRAYALEAGKDVLDTFVADMPEEKADALKRAIRSLAKATGLDLEAAAEVVIAAANQ